MELHRPWWYWRVMSLKSKSIRTVIFLQGRRRGSGGGGGMREKTGAGRWDEFYAVEDTGSSWFLKPCGFRPKKQQLKFAFCCINGIRSNTGTTEQVWESGEVGWEGGGGGGELNPSFRVRMWGGPGMMLPSWARYETFRHREIARKYR